MKERPILMSAPMVRATLREVNPKTVTRRLVKWNYAGRVQLHWRQWHIDDPNVVLGCPYGGPSDRLWCRESYRFGAEWDDTKPSQVPPVAFSEDDPHTGIVYYEADGLMKRPEDNGWGKLRHGIFMPRWASRITLEIVSVRAERVQDITEEDAIAEGLDPGTGESVSYWHSVLGHYFIDPRSAYADLWDSINGPGSWARNDWVWRIEYRRIKP